MTLCKLKSYLKFSNIIVLVSKQERKARQRLAFLPVSKARTNKIYITVNWDILASGYFGSFLSKCGCLILVCLWCFPKDDCFISVLFKWLEKINARDQCFFFIVDQKLEVKYHRISPEVC
jgi:hypothetical protein